jgi:hypothetical protein
LHPIRKDKKLNLMTKRSYENRSLLFIEATGEGVHYKKSINKPFKRPSAPRQKICCTFKIIGLESINSLCETVPLNMEKH